MVGIVSGSSTGLNLSGMTPFGRRGTLGQPGVGNNGEQAYVNAANGNLVLQHLDASAMGRGIDLSLLRTYNSQGKFTDDNADGWWVGGYRRLVNLTGTVNTAGSTVQRVDSDGSVLTFSFNATTGKYQAATGSGKFDTLAYNATTQQWTWTEASTQNKETYSVNGSTWRLVSQADAAGNTVTYGYTGNLLTSIKDANGETLELVYTGNNLTQERIRQADGTLVSNTYYRYDAQNRLSQVKVDLTPTNNSIADGAVYVTTYGYVGTSNLVSSVTQTDGSQLNLTYVNVGGVNRVATVTDALGRTTSFAYDTTNRTTTVTDAQGNKTVYTYDTANRFTKVVGPAVNGVAQSVTYQYDTAGNVLRSTDALGNYVAYTYDANGNVLTQTDSLGNKILNQYNAANRLIASTTYRAPAAGTTAASNPETTRYLYDAQNNPRFAISPEGRVTEYRYDAYGQRTAAITYPAAKYPLTDYADPGKSPTLAQLTTWAAAQNQSLTNRTDYAYNARGQLASTTTYAAMNADGTGLANGTQTTLSFTYDVTGHLLTAVDGRKQQTSYVYDGLGRVLSTTNASGTATNAYDDANHTIVHKQLDGRVDTAIFDRAGQQLATIMGGAARTEYRYDALGRLILTIDPTGNKQFQTYDAAGRVQALIDGRGNVTQFLYNAAGQRVQTVRHSVPLTATQMTTLLGSTGTAATATPPVPSSSIAKWAGTTAYAVGTQVVYGGKVYQAVTASTNVEPDGTTGAWKEVPLTGQTLDWVPTLKYAVNDTVTYGGAVYKALRANQGATPNLAGSADWSLVTAAPKTAWTDNTALWPIVAGDQVSFELYDKAGRLVKTVDAMGHVTERQYDGAGNLVAVIARATAVGTGSLTAASTPESVVTVASSADRIVYNYYDLDNRLVASVDGERYVTQYKYDNAGRPVETVRYATAVASTVTLSPSTAVTALIPAANSADQHTYTLYDSESRVVAMVDAENYLTEYGYDTNGNRTSIKRYATRAPAVTATSTLATLRPAANGEDQTTTIVYDALNRVSTTTNPEGAVTQYTYDKMNRVTSTTTAYGTADARTVSQRYDALGRVIGVLSGVGSAQLVAGQTQAQIDAVWAQYGTTYAYDSAGRRISATDQYGGKTRYYYDQSGNLTHTINPLGEVEERRYDAFGHLTATVRYGTRLSSTALATLTGGLVNATLTTAIAGIVNAALDSKTSVTYNLDGTVKSMTDALNATTTYGYDAFGDRTSAISPIASGRTLTETYTYDHRGLQTAVTSDPTGANVIRRAVYDAFGRPTAFVNGNSVVTPRGYDRLGRTVLSGISSLLRQDTYDVFGRTLTHTDANGAVTTYVYNKAARTITVTTPEGIQYVTTHNLQGQTVSVKDGNGNTTTYTYDKDGNLKTTATPLTTTKADYDRAGRLAMTTDANGKTVIYAYDAASRLFTRTVDNGGLALVTKYGYDAKGQQITVTDPNGVVTQIDYDLKGQVLRQTVDPTGLKLVTSYTYDQRGKQLTVTAPNGSVVQYVYDNLGRRTEQHVDPAGLNLTTRYTYDKNDNVVAVTDPLGNVTRYAYDAADRLIYTVSATGAVQKLTYDRENRVTQTLNYATAISLSGLGLAVTTSQIAALAVPNAADSVVNKVYDKNGRLRWTIDGMGDVVGYTYDKNDNVIDRIAYAKRIALASWTPGSAPAVVADAAHDERVRTVYDALNRAQFTMDGRGAVSAYKYDNNGNVIDRIDYAKLIPVTTAMTAAAITTALQAVANAAVDHHSRMVYDAANRLTWVANGVGGVTQYVYDKDGRIVKEVHYATAIAATTAPSAVAASANDRVTLYAYDNAGRAAWKVDSLGGVTRNVYDANGNVIQRIAYAKPIAAPTTATVAPTAAALATTVVADATNDRVTSQTYDAAGRLVFSVDSLGAVSESRYDADGRVTATVRYATPVAVPLAAGFTTASVRALVKADATKDRTTQRAYDAAGHLVYTVDPLGYVTKNTYDTLGRVTATTAYAKPIAATTANTVAAIGAAIVADANVDETTQYRFDNAGNLLGLTDALGKTEQYTVDALGNRLSFTNKLGVTWTYSYDAAGNRLTEVAPPATLTRVTADANGNLVSSETANVYVTTAMTYDAFGNVLTRTEGAGLPESRTTSYGYDALGRQTITVLPPVATYNESENVTTNGATGVATRSETTTSQITQTFYDALGNATMSRDVAGNYSYKAYDRLGRVVYDVDALGYVTGYQRNAFGDATVMTRYALVPNTGLSAGTVRTAAALSTAIAALSHTADRSITTVFDRLGRAVTVTEPASWVSNGVQGANAAKVTKNTFNAFGQLVTSAVLADSVAGTYATTTHYYDRDGRETLTVDPMGFATARTYDAVGNLTRVTEYATPLSAWTPATPALPAANAADRTTDYAYDRLNRLVKQTRQNVQYSDGTSDPTTGTRTSGAVATTYGYDAVGNRTSVTDAMGSTTYTYYDAQGRVKAVALPVRTSSLAGNAVTPLTEFRRDALGNVTVKIDYANGATAATATGYTAGAASANDRRTLAKYDSHNNVIQNTDANGVNHYASYDGFGHVRKEWLGVSGNDGVVHTKFTVYKYDALGRRIATITPASTMQLSGTTFTTVTQATAGVVTEQAEYNAFGEVIRQGVNGGRQVYYDYDNAGHMWRTNSGDGVDKVFVYDLQGHQTVMLSSAGQVNGAVVGSTPLTSAANAQAAEGLAGMRRTTSQVDLLGRVLTLTLPDRGGVKPQIKQTFDRWGNVLTRSNLYATNSVTVFQYDANNNIIVQKDPDSNGAQSTNSPTTLTYYDRLGRRIAVKDANGNLSRTDYDRAGNVTAETHADGGVARSYWDTYGQLVGERDANGNLTTYTLDKLGRVVQATTAAVGVYTVNTSNVLGGSTQQLVTKSAYDQAGRLLWRTTPAGEKTSYDYDLRGNVVGTHLPLGQVQLRAYDYTGRLIGLKDANNQVTTWTYDYFGLLTAHRDIGGATYAYTYDTARQLVKQTNTRGENLSYRYDGVGQQIEVYDATLDKYVLTAWNVAGQKTREQVIQKDKRYQDSWLAYNAQGLLARVDSPNDGLSVLMEYDKLGNLVHKQTQQVAKTAGVATQTMVIDGVNHTVTQEVSAATARTDNLWYAYDSMRRQKLIEGAVDANASNNANITSTQGHRETYDYNGNRTSDTSYGEALVPQIVNGVTTYVRHTGLITRYYQYDAENRLIATSLAAYDSAWNALPAAQAVTIEQIYYDGAGRVVQQGPGPLMPAAYRTALGLPANADLAQNFETTQKRYDANGRMLSEHVTELNGTLRFDTSYTSYDNEGNPLAYTTVDASGTRSSITIAMQALDDLKRASITNNRTTANGTHTVTSTTYAYDKNGYLVSTTVTPASGSATVRGFVNDAEGRIVRSLENGKTVNRLLADGHIMETWTGTSSGTAGGLLTGQPAARAATSGFWALRSTRVSAADGGPKTANPGGLAPLNKDPVDKSGVVGATRGHAVGGGTTCAAPGKDMAATSATVTSEASATSGPRVNYFDESGNAIVSVQPGDTLQSLAQAAYGSPDLWYLIADANGIATNSDLSSLGTIKVPTQSTVTVTSPTTGEVTSSTTTVYHSTDGSASGVSESDFWNLIPGKPGHGGGGCGGLGKVLVAVVAVAVAVVAGPVVLGVVGPALGGGVAGAVAAGAVTGAVASVASQAVGIAIGEQDSFSWKGVALGAISGGVGAGVGAAVSAAGADSALGSLAGNGVLETAGRAVVGNVITQGVEVATGLKDSFSWKDAAIAGATAGVNTAVSGAVGSALEGTGTVGQIITDTTAGLASGVTGAILNGGHVDVGAILTDAFGNAIGNAVGGAINDSLHPATPGEQPGTQDDPGPADPTDPVDPLDPIDPIDPFDPTDPVDPMDHVDPTDPMDPIDDPDSVDPLPGIDDDPYSSPGSDDDPFALPGGFDPGIGGTDPVLPGIPGLDELSDMGGDDGLPWPTAYGDGPSQDDIDAVKQNVMLDLMGEDARAQSLQEPEMILTGGGSVRGAPSVGAFEMVRNAGWDAALNIAADPFGLLGELPGLQADLAQLNRMQAKDRVDAMRAGLAKLGVKNLPDYSYYISGSGSGIDFQASMESLGRVYEGYVRDQRMRANWGDDYENIRIGKSQMKPAEFEQKVLDLHLQATDDAYAKGVEKIASGELKISKAGYAATLGSYIDDRVRTTLRDFAKAENISDNPMSNIWAINRRIENSTVQGYGIPDGRLGLNLYHDTTLALKNAYTPQVTKWNAIRPGTVIVVRPTELGGPYVIPQRGIQPYVPQVKTPGRKF